MILISSQTFASLWSAFEFEGPIAVAVSGGADSMALVLLLQEFQKNLKDPKFSIIAITVDHQLRPESQQEALQVQRWMQRLSIPHTILTWQHPPLKTQIEERAREARYQLIEAYCRTHAIPVLVTAHHAGDQRETFFMRLARGAGLTGLCSIRPITLRGVLQIIRPCLNVTSEALKNTLTQRFQHPFIEDPSNHLEQFERVRFRKQASQWTSLGLTEEKINQSIQRLQRLENELFQAAQCFEKNYTRKGSSIFLDQTAFQKLLPSIAKLTLRRLLIDWNPIPTPCTDSMLDRVYEKIQQPSFKAVTAHGCVIRKTRNQFLKIDRENRPRPSKNTMGTTQDSSSKVHLVG